MAQALRRVVCEPQMRVPLGQLDVGHKRTIPSLRFLTVIPGPRMQLLHPKTKDIVIIEVEGEGQK